MNKTRLLVNGGTSRMIAATKLHKRTREDGAARLVMPATTHKLAARPVTATTNEPTITHHKSAWSDPPKSDRRGRDIAAARAEARREAMPAKPVQPLFG